MKTEPLKNKVVYVGNLCKDKDNHTLRVALESDLKSAVERLRKRLKKQTEPFRYKEDFREPIENLNRNIDRIINEDFEDVVKKE